MKTFENIHFNGTFRSYQSDVLKNANNHLKDKKIHIVAAPGSGKTILGLELIRGLNRPAIVLSPSVTIRQQWGERFEGNFMPSEENINDYVSYDLKNPALITSVTYQALHSAYNKKRLNAKANEDADEFSENEDFTDFDLVKTAKKYGISTICLDEAHHLRSEWQKSLEGFIKDLGNNVVLISLTATPPYDSTPTEWKRYNDLCGEIDEEIFVPQLVLQKTLCPHQDYVMFSYPTSDEENAISEYRKKANAAVQEIMQSDILARALSAICNVNVNSKVNDFIYDNYDSFSDILTLAYYINIKLSQKLLAIITKNGKVQEFSLKIAENAFQFIIDIPKYFGEECVNSIKQTLLKYSLIDKSKVCLETNEKLNNALVSSLGKLESINKIVNSEFNCLKDELRMLILTDFIKKDLLSLIGTNDKITTMGTTPIFESIRRSVDPSVKLAVLSGTLVILPNQSINKVFELADKDGISHTAKQIENTNYSVVTFSGSNKNKVSIITEAFGQGLINVLIGTKSLLGEGWDSPCINSLILASFVGSFMLSNQMRGRAIRIDKNNTDKVSNIWHLITVDSNAKDSDTLGNDYNTVKRRFECFLAPAFHSNNIESGIDRLDIIKPPYTKENFNAINSQMLQISTDRASLAQKWNAAVTGGNKAQISEVCEVPKSAQPKISTAKHKIIILLIIFLAAALVIISFVTKKYILIPIVSILALIIGMSVFITKIKKLGHPEYSTKSMSQAILYTLQGIGVIQSKNVKLVINSDFQNEGVRCTITNATEHEKNVFSGAVAEFFSEIDNPRYIILRNNSYQFSFSCPTIISTKKENVELLCSYLNKNGGRYNCIYSRNPNGRQALLYCRMKSYLNNNSAVSTNKKAVI